MLDIKFIKENKDLIELAAKKKRVNFDVNELISVDDERLVVLKRVEDLRAEQNLASRKIAVEKDSNVRDQMISEMKILKEDLEKGEDNLRELIKKWQVLMLSVPNIPDISVPEGEDDSSNVEAKVWGEKPVFQFTPKDHIALMESLDIADFVKGAEVAGFRGYFLKGDGALLEFALHQFVVSHFSSKKSDYEFMIVPSLVRRETLFGTGYLPQGEDDMYKTQDSDYFSGTAEVATMSYFTDTVFEPDVLPKKVLAFSPAFRREAGSHSKDTKGLFRVHEFRKFEQVILCEANHETSVKHHEELLSNAEEILQALGLHYHVVINCGGDLGLGQVKKYDIEAWVPSQDRFRETHSCSYFHDFQTRRLNIRYKDSEGKLRYAHSLNNTALAMPRILQHIVENYQQEDGSIIIPEVLRPYMGGKEKILPKK
ncbi:MAG: serine--tRNA ligase [Candidatus Pacebacteria bacterium]|nr:serine--tRNA ligase [Candidatus Paceibacterota bacterium]MBP9058674.1 serine--tRNA ligase [Candidatus Paceibacterota bacterium]MBP9769956.1 serine--tRNA ligase [Candidatus Paceibacterota bacterium]